jgi:hypothetical protein
MRWKKPRRVGSLGRDQPSSSFDETPKGTVARHSEATTRSSWEEGTRKRPHDEEKEHPGGPKAKRGSNPRAPKPRADGHGLFEGATP